MLLIDINSIFCLFVCAQITESKVYILRDYDDEPLYIDTGDRGLHEKHHHSKHKPLPNLGYKPKRSRTPKQAILHYGRHTYHLDSFDDLTKLRSQLDPDYISYDYFDINDLFRSSDSDRSIPWDYVEDFLFLAPRPLFGKNCKEEQCDDNLRKYMYKLKHGKNAPDSEKGNEKTKLLARQNTYGLIKRFKIIDNSKLSKKKAVRKPLPKKKIDSSEEFHDKSKSTYNKKHSSESASSSNESKEKKDWSASNSGSEEKFKKNKNNKYVSNSASSEDTKHKFQKQKKNYGSDQDSASFESKLKLLDNSIEDNWQKKKKKKKKTYSSDENQKRKTFEDEEMILQGNNMYDTHGLSDDTDEDKRRRLPQFLPKRYHWDPSDINELGYYWFNGPKGRYPSPTNIGRRKI